MRLFIAIKFPENVIDNLCQIIDELKENAIEGNFTNRHNLHLTVVFIGETAKINVIKEILDMVNHSNFNLTISKLGRFRRDNGDICWAGIENSSELSAIYNKLYAELKKNGFNLENRDFKPHITLGRSVKFSDGFNYYNANIEKISMKVEKVSLMKSERIKENLVYTEIYYKSLQNNQA